MPVHIHIDLHPCRSNPIDPKKFLKYPVKIYWAVVVDFGRSLPRGKLPVFSVSTEEEAKKLLVLACPTNISGEFIAPELAETQNLENLQHFSERLAKAHQILIDNDQCECHDPGDYPVDYEKCETCGLDPDDCFYECENCRTEYCLSSYENCPNCGW